MASYTGNDTDLLFSGETQSDHDDTELLSAQEAVKKLEESWLNEMLAPDLLIPQTELVDCLLEQTKNMEENLATVSKSDFRYALHRMEVERIQFVITSYLRIRIEKIEKFLNYVLDVEGKRLRNEPSLLTEAELKFAEELNVLTEQHLKTLGLRHMPAVMRDIDAKKFMILPNRDSHVFIRVKNDAPSVLVNGIGGEQEVDLLKDSQHLLPFQSIVSLLENGNVNLL